MEGSPIAWVILAALAIAIAAIAARSWAARSGASGGAPRALPGPPDGAGRAAFRR
jgi:hypothetical protein